ncbi:ECF transporter S component [Latilactobacillus graminis]|uniref:Integral membrane protein n=2 Tax=Latilactobacillus graminis TaxID=60519 RepID=A0AA89I026_9LACO|nr:ECF transporter S component [Latilactobacillus graminis]KRM21155.1 integral membrane protein [Latilactobacillus graminis DSM 20719]QFP79282.1 ECF transporter S component [Latilactobacillus graminis]
MHFNKHQLPLLAMLTALTVALSLLIIIPIPATKGFVTLCEVGIYTTAIMLGNPGGLAVGATSGLLIDLLSGYPEWCLFSLIIHGAQGFVVSHLTHGAPRPQKLIIPFICGSIVMVLGYFLATRLLFGWAAGITSIFSNIVQNGIGIVVTIPLVTSLSRIRPQLFNH